MCVKGLTSLLQHDLQCIRFLRRQRGVVLAECFARFAYRRLNALAQVLGKLAAKISQRPLALVADGIGRVQLARLFAPFLVLFSVLLA